MNHIPIILLALMLLGRHSSYAQNSHYDPSSDTLSFPKAYSFPSLKDGKKLSFEELKAQEMFFNSMDMYKNTLPILGFIGMRNAKHRLFGTSSNIISIRSGNLKSNIKGHSIPSFGKIAITYVDLKKEGAVVFDMPAELTFVISDLNRRPIAQYVNTIERKQLLIVPPKFDSPIPPDFIVYHSPTYNISLEATISAMFNESGELDFSKTNERVNALKDIIIYPLKSDDIFHINEMQFLEMDQQIVDTRMSKGFQYWKELKEIIDHEEASLFPPILTYYLKKMGLEKGKPFNPTDQEKEILTYTVDIAPQLILEEMLSNPQSLSERYIFPDRYWVNFFKGVDDNWLKNNYLHVEEKARYFSTSSSTFGSSPSKVRQGFGKACTFFDSEGTPLNGSNHYRIFVDGNMAKIWTVNVYNAIDGSYQDVEDDKNAIASFQNIEKNKDGSANIYFGPEKPKGVSKNNWIQTLPNTYIMVSFRLVGASKEFYNLKMPPEDIERYSEKK